MSRWLDLYRQAAVPVDTPVQIGQKGAVSPQVNLSAPKYLSAQASKAKNTTNPALSPVPLTSLYPVPPGDEWLADGWYALRQRPGDIEERAAIMEYDGELSREEAERAARQV